MPPILRERFELAKESFTLDREDLKELFNSSKRESDIVSSKPRALSVQLDRARTLVLES